MFFDDGPTYIMSGHKYILCICTYYQQLIFAPYPKHMHQVEINYESPIIHLNQILCGFFLLQSQKKIKLKINTGNYKEQYPFLNAVVNGKKIVYDMADRSAVNEEMYGNCDYYFKRMCLKTDLHKYDKLRPYGFNYNCFSPGLNFLSINARLLPVAEYKKLAKYIPYLSGFFKIANAINNTIYTEFEKAPDGRKFQVIFSARLWDAEKSSNEKLYNERVRINNERIQLVRNLRAKFGSDYTGGIQKGYLVNKLAPDTVLSDEMYYKPNYLKKLKQSTVAIATAGLEDSVGFKFGEYIAAGNAIATTPDFEQYAFPGNFTKNENYLIYNNDDECLSLIEMLKNDKSNMQKIMVNNYAYYNEYLRPDKLILNTLNKVN
jgi:hypothetical protein